MHRCVAAFASLLSALLILGTCEQSRLTPEEARLVLDSLEHKLDWLSYRIFQESWEFYTTGRSDSLDFYRDLYAHVTTDEKTLRRIRLAKPLMTEEVNLRRWRLAHEQLLLSQVEAKADIRQLRDSLSEIDISYRAEFEGEDRTNAYLYQIYRSDSDRDRRQGAYRAWCSLGLELDDGLEKLFRLRNQEARRLGYTNYLAMVFGVQGYDPLEYRALLDRLDSLSEQPYKEILQKIGEQLGYSDVEIWDIGYAYAGIRQPVDGYFPADSQMAYIRAGLKGIGFDIDKLPIYFDLESRPGKSQLAYAFPIKPPHDVRILANMTDGLYSTRVLLHEIGHALHFVHVTQTEPFFRMLMSGSWEEGMAQTIAALCDEREWLRAYAGLPPELVDRYLAAKREREIISLRVTLLRLRFEYEAYVDPSRDLNALYWALFEDILKLPRHEDIKPWAAIIHYTTHPVYLHNYLIADIIAAQTVSFFRANYGHVVGNLKVGSYLVQNYFRFGARYDWRELLERGTGEQLNPDYLITSLQIGPVSAE